MSILDEIKGFFGFARKEDNYQKMMASYRQELSSGMQSLVLKPVPMRQCSLAMQNPLRCPIRLEARRRTI